MACTHDLGESGLCWPWGLWQAAGLAVEREGHHASEWLAVPARRAPYSQDQAKDADFVGHCVGTGDVSALCSSVAN